MSVTSIALVAAVVTSLVAAVIPADRVGDRQARSWVPAAWRRYRVKLLGLQVAATVVLSLGAMQIGWEPAEDASGFQAAAHGVGWAIAAVALLRADFSGLRAGEAAPGFSLLRSFSDHFTGALRDEVSEAVRAHLPADRDELKQRALQCKSRAFRPRPDGTLTPDAKATSAAIELLHREPTDDDLRELMVELVVTNRLPKCW